MNTKQEKLDYINRECNTNYKLLRKVNWQDISWKKKLSEDFIREFKNKLNWYDISSRQKLSEDFIREFKDKVNWIEISYYQQLSEDFIREFKDEVCWCDMSRCQKLSEDFIREFADYVDWEFISRYQKLSENFIYEFKDKLDISLIEDNWIYKDAQFLKQQVINTGLYECYDDYFIGYKGIRGDRYSKFNFQYQYMSGETYESWCDCGSDKNSFGLSVWTEEKACIYCNELVVKVKVNYEDVGRVVHEGGKIRCRKITVLD